MNISNDLNCLKQQIQHLESAKEQLIILKKDFPKSVDDMFNAGNRDQQFILLKNAVSKSEGDLMKIIENLEIKLSELRSRSELIESYYQISL
jgi:hypothetical protein